MPDLRHIKLRQIECFVEIARQSSVTRAAQVLNLTQPAVTRSLRELEDALEHPLTERLGRGIKLTEFGEIYLRHAGESLAALRRGSHALDDLTAHEGPPLRVGALPTVSARIMPAAAALYLKSAARAPLIITSGVNLTLLEELRNGELDLVLGRLPSPELMQGLSFEPFYNEKVVFVVNSDHPLLSMPSISVEALSAYPTLLPSRSSIIRPYVDRLFVEQGIAVPIQKIETVSDSFGRAFTRSNQAIWVISEGVVAAEIASGEFRLLPINTDTTLGAVGLNMSVNGSFSPSAQIFCDIVRELVRTMASTN